MAIREKEYLLSVDPFRRPKVLTKQQAIAMNLLHLILLDPGSDPLHPEMGVGIRDYRYAMGKEEELRERVEDQISRFLPCYPSANVELNYMPDHTINIEITIDDAVYVYDSAEAPIKITLDDIDEFQIGNKLQLSAEENRRKENINNY